MKQQHPESLASDAKRVKTGCGDMHVAVTQFENKPFEVFITLGKSGRCKNCMLEALGGLLSWGLRSGADIKKAPPYPHPSRSFNDLTPIVPSIKRSIPLNFCFSQ